MIGAECVEAESTYARDLRLAREAGRSEALAEAVAMVERMVAEAEHEERWAIFRDISMLHGTRRAVLSLAASRIRAMGGVRS